MQKELAPNVTNIKRAEQQDRDKKRDGDQNARTKREPLVFFQPIVCSLE